MKRVIIILMVLISFNVLNAQENRVNSSRVTYLANSGFLIEAGEEAIMFDGLFNNGMDKYWAPTEITVNAIRKALPPFDKVSLAFVSNKYANHFDPFLATEFMMNNKDVKLICPQQVINKMKIFTVQYAQIKDRIIETTPVANHYDRFLINDIEILACRVLYNDNHYEHIENMVYMVNVQGVKILHTGDSRPSEMANLKGIDFSSMNIDLAFISDNYALGKNAKLTNQLIDAQYNVLMHFEKYVKTKQIENFAKRCKLNSIPTVFTSRNEYLDFYLEDYIPRLFEPSKLASVN